MSQAQVHKFAQVQKIVQQHPFVYAEVTDQANNLVIAGNSGKVKVKDWLTRKVAPLIKEWPTPGVYFFKFYTDKQKRALPHTYAVQLGSGGIGEAPTSNMTPVHIHNAPVHMAESDKVLSYSEVLKIQQELAKLQAENEYLKRGGNPSQLEEDDDEEDEDEEPTQTLGEKMVGTFKTIAEGVIPVLDTMFKQRDRETQLKWAQFTMQNPQFAPYSPYKMPVPNQTPPETVNDGPHPLLAICDQWLSENVATQDEDTYNAIMDLSESTQTFEEFCKGMNEQFPEIYKAMYNHVTTLQKNEPVKKV